METLILVGFVIWLLYWCRGHIGKGYSYDLGGSKRKFIIFTNTLYQGKQFSSLAVIPDLATVSLSTLQKLE